MTFGAQQAYGAYTTHQRADENVRETEARALLSCASKLDFARRDESSMDDYIFAIKHNQQLWTIFQVAICEADNPLPRELKVLLLNLSRYVDKVSFQALTEFKPELLNSLISINRTIAAGLTTAPQQGSQQATPLDTTSPQATINTSA